MKKLLGIAVLSLCWFSSVYSSEELNNYQIGKYKFGESLTKYFPKNTIDQYKSCQLTGGDRFCTLSMLKDNTTGVFDAVQFIFDQDDDNYRIHSLKGDIHFSKWNECQKEQELAINFYKSRFGNIIKQISDDRAILQTYLEKPNFVSSITFYFNNDAGGQIGCYSVSNETFIKYGFTPKPTNIYLTMSLSSKDFVGYHNKAGVTKEYFKKTN